MELEHMSGYHNCNGWSCIIFLIFGEGKQSKYSHLAVKLIAQRSQLYIFICRQDVLFLHVLITKRCEHFSFKYKSDTWWNTYKESSNTKEDFNINFKTYDTGDHMLLKTTIL